MSEALEDLVRRAQGGDGEALGRLLAESRPALTRLSARVCPPQDVEDAVQEILVRASAQIGALRVARAFVSWSARMLVRECLRYKERALRFVVGAPEEHAPVPTESDLSRALSSISQQSREILLYRDVLGHTGPEAAEVLGISVESAKSRLRRARAHLRLALEA